MGLAPRAYAATTATTAASAASAPAEGAGAAGRMRLVTAHLPPLVLEHGGRRPGALMELVAELCKRMRPAAPAPWAGAEAAVAAVAAA